MKIKMYLFLLFSLIVCANVHAASLFKHFKGLEDKVPHIPLANLPTPIYRCHNLEKILEHDSIFIKRDDLTGSGNLYGGNKVRKLAFLLADAVRSGAKKIVTFGSAGTNHGLATACYCKELGLDCLLMLKNQPNSPVVRQNLLLDHYFNAEIEIFANNVERKAALDEVLKTNNDIYFFPTGGSIPLGALGYVDAAFELKEQIEKGDMPKPDLIYLPVGSCGTTAGLLLGLALAQIDSKIIAIAVEPEEKLNEFEETTKKLFSETNQLLNSFCDALPIVEFPNEQLIINKNFCGEQYGLWMRCVEDIVRVMKNEEGIIVEGTYSAKPIAALIADIRNHTRNSDEVILVWNTYCGLDFSHLTDTVDYKQLNPKVHRYFEDAQLVDVSQTNPTVILDLKFATADNFTGEVLYSSPTCLLLKIVAESLAEAVQEFESLGYKVKIWDGYRPPKVSAKLWELMPDARFIADPKDGGSRHNRGCAIDLTLIDAHGNELDMGTCFCHFSERSYRDYQDLPAEVLRNRKFLETVMEKHGFVGLKTEWWHFDYKHWLQYPIIDISL